MGALRARPHVRRGGRDGRRAAGRSCAAGGDLRVGYQERRRGARHRDVGAAARRHRQPRRRPPADLWRLADLRKGQRRHAVSRDGVGNGRSDDSPGRGDGQTAGLRSLPGSPGLVIRRSAARARTHPDTRHPHRNAAQLDIGSWNPGRGGSPDAGGTPFPRVPHPRHRLRRHPPARARPHDVGVPVPVDSRRVEPLAPAQNLLRTSLENVDGGRCRCRWCT